MQNFNDFEKDIESMDDGEIVAMSKSYAGLWNQDQQKTIEEAIDMRKFCYLDGGQWDDGIANSRRIRGKLSLENNMLRRLIRKMVADYKQSPGDALVTPTNTTENSIDVKIIQDILRNVAYESNAHQQYGFAYLDLLVSAFCAVEIVCTKENRNSYNNVLRIVGVKDVLTCGWDPKAPDFFKVEGDFCYIDFEMSKRKIGQIYDVDVSTLVGVDAKNISNSSQDKENILLRKLYVKDFKSTIVYEMENGEKILKDDFEIKVDLIKKDNAFKKEKYEKEKEKLSKLNIDVSNLPEPDYEQEPEIKKKHKEVDWDIWLLICSGNACLKRTKLPIKKLPLYYCAAETVIVDGKEYPQSYAVDAKTPQKLMNYYVSEMADGVNRNPGVRIIADDQTIAQYPTEWQTPGAQLTLRYNSGLNPGGAPKSPPQLINPTAIDQSLLQGYLQAQQDISNVIGANSNAEEGPATSGIDFLYRQLSMNSIAGVFPDALNQLIAEVNKGLLEWLPYVYDTERPIRLRDKYGKVSQIIVNQDAGDVDENTGKKIIQNSLKNIGEFSVEINGGPSFAAQRFAGLTFLKDVMQSNPAQLQPIMLDKAIEEAPFGFSQEISQRLITSGFINPKVLPEDERPKAEPQKPPLEEKLFKLEVIKSIAELFMKAKEMKQKDLEVKLKGLDQLLDFKGQKRKADAEERKSEAENFRSAMDSVTDIIADETKNLETMGELASMQNEIDKSTFDQIMTMLQDVVGAQEEIATEILENT